MFCGSVCRGDAETTHASFCGCVAEVERLGSSLNIDSDLLLFAFKGALQMGHDRRTKEKAKKKKAKTLSKKKRFISRRVHVSDMIANKALSGDISAFKEVVAPLLALVPPEERQYVHDSDFETVLLATNSNSHSLSMALQPYIHFGLGLFPLAACVNHSCNPNCTYTNVGSKLAVRALRDIAEGEELTVNYVDISQDRYAAMEGYIYIRVLYVGGRGTFSGLAAVCHVLIFLFSNVVCLHPGLHAENSSKRPSSLIASVKCVLCMFVQLRRLTDIRCLRVGARVPMCVRCICT